MAPRYGHILHAIASSPWAILPEKLQAILAVIETRATGGRVSLEEIQAAKEAARSRTSVAPSGQIAVLPVFGTISPRMDLFSEMSGGTSAVQLGRDFDALVADETISTIVLDVDSPGGNVYGIQELAAKIHAARGKKRVIAVADHLMASAAYWLGTAAEEVVASPSSEVGSIGVFGVHTDASKFYEERGLAHTIVSAGKYKTEGNNLEPLSDTAREAMQATIDEYYDQFVKAVAKHRGVKPAAVRGGFGEGRCLPTRAALEAGMIDRIATLDQVLGELAGGKVTRSSGKSAMTVTLDKAAAVGTTERQIAALGATATDGLGNVVALEVRRDGTVVHIYDTENTGARAGGAADVERIPVANRPHAAKEHTVKDETNGGQNGATTESEAPSAEESFVELAALSGKTLADIQRWKREGKTVKQVRDELLAEVANPTPVVRMGAERETQKPWRSFGEQVAAIIFAGKPGVDANGIDRRLFAGVTGMSQGVPSEGGFLVAPQFSQKIWDGLNEAPDSLLSRTDSYTVEGESLTFNANAETSRATGSRYGGMQAFWIAEADQVDKSKPKFRQVRLEPQQLAVLVYLTDKLIKNSPVALEQYVSRAAVEEINFMVGNAIYNGSGAGQPAGLMGSGSLVSVLKETGQAAATIVQKNISKMWKRLHPRSRGNAVWLHNVDIEDQLDALSTVVQNVAGTENVGGYANKVFDPERRTLKGRPLVACEYAETLGTKGDLMLVDLGAYASGVRGGVESAISMHLRFDYLEQALRFVFEVDGQPWLASALTPFKGTATLTTHVVLDTRS